MARTRNRRIKNGEGELRTLKPFRQSNPSKVSLLFLSSSSFTHALHSSAFKFQQSSFSFTPSRLQIHHSSRKDFCLQRLGAFFWTSAQGIPNLRTGPVSTQFWMSSMFSPGVVGTANGLSGGWGNLGGGATQLIMPLVYSLIHSHIGSTKFTAWRIAFFIPASFQTLSAFAIFFLGQDMPDGNYVRLEKSGEKHKDNFSQVFYHAISNYRGWILALTYGYCFGVELTIDNIIAQYFYDRFNVNLHTAGIIAASFGLANLFSRPGGGILSDVVAKRFGMRGRLWTLWVVQMVGGLLCLLLGKVGSLTASVAVMLVFSVFVQAACGLTFGVVPFVSRRSLGVISGMTGGGGNVGAVLTQVIFFRGSRYSTEEGITLMGVMIMCCTLPILFIYFPQWGGLFYGPTKGATEQDYYLSEWSSAEKEQGFHKMSVKFADNSRSERGNKGAPAPILSDKENSPTIV